MSGPRIEREVPVVLAQWIDNTRFLRVGHLLPGLDEDHWDRMCEMGYVGALLETRRAKRGKRTVTHSRHGLVPNRTGVPEVQNNWISHILPEWGLSATRPWWVWWPRYVLNTDFTLEVVQNWSEFSSVEPKLEDWVKIATGTG
ncbi:hypothetical protein DFH08DRAFT_819373 [Mycena albidolilacea]|uniref:Uncharacterized protein n=1 Tax=Mycena albidolilacea TaxID=1033008 RepID=A0AAD6ZF34_9AGAR|nr:hypothetical protein DFH08DRAFT_819373 [Mycena albidolilacea]